MRGLQVRAMPTFKLYKDQKCVGTFQVRSSSCYPRVVTGVSLQGFNQSQIEKALAEVGAKKKGD